MDETRIEPGTRAPRWAWTRLALSAAAAFTMIATCDPDEPPPKAEPPKPLAKAPCPVALWTDQYTSDGIDTRTGCMMVSVTLGSVAGAADLALPVLLVRNEGKVPPAALYPSAWFGQGSWLSVDEYVTKEKKGVYTLHTPAGDVIYDFEAWVPDWKNLDPDDDSKTKRWTEYRTRPFDGTFLYEGPKGYYITAGNPADSRSLFKRFEGALPGAAADSSARLLTRLEKASIYKGPRNSIDIQRTYGKDSFKVRFTTSLYDGSGVEPLTIDVPGARGDGEPGYSITSKTTLLHGWTSTVTALVNGSGNVERVAATGRNAEEQHHTTFGYHNEEKPEATVFESIVEEEGPAGDLRTRRSLRLSERADAANAAFPFAVGTMIDRSHADAEMTHVVSQCDKDGDSSEDALPKFLRFNYADGTSAIYEYTVDRFRNQLARVKDTFGKNTKLSYNFENGGGNNRTEVTGYELRVMEVGMPGVPQPQFFFYRFDRFSADWYRIPRVGKVSIPKGLVGDKQVLYRAVYGDLIDQYNESRRIRSFDLPRIAAGADGRTRWEYRGLDGFLYEAWDEDDVMTSYRWLDQDKRPDGSYDKETFDVYLMGVAQMRTVRDRFGRLLQEVTNDPALPADKQPTQTFHINDEGFTDRIEDSGSGETFQILGWNGPRTAITSGSLARGNKSVSSYTLPADDFANQDGAGNVTLGSVEIQTLTERYGGGPLKRSAITGPSGQTLSTELGYAPKDSVPNERGLNGSTVITIARKKMTAKGGCK